MQSDGVHRPCLPITLGYERREFPVGHALVDSGSDVTVFPLAVAHLLEIELDDSGRISLGSAGGDTFVCFPSREKVTFTIEHSGYRPIRWQAHAYFAQHEPVLLLGHRGCLEKFDVTLRGPEKLLQIIPRF